MNKRLPLWLMTAAVVLGLAACPLGALFGPPPPPLTPGGNIVPVVQCPRPETGLSGCLRNIDCPAETFCVKEEGAGIEDPGCCTAAQCADDTSCSSEATCDVSTGVCVLPPVCDASAAGTPACDDEEALCRFELGLASCALDHPPPVVCTAAPAFLHAAPGDVVAFEVTGTDELGNRQPLAGPVTLTGNVLDDGGNGGAIARCDATTPCAGRVQIEAPGVACFADLIVTPPRPAFTHVRLIDADTGASLAGRVHVVRDGGGETVDVSDDGLAAIFTGEPWRAVTGLVDGHRAVTVLEPPAGDLVLPLRARAVGTVRTWPSGGDLPTGTRMHLVGTSMAGPGYELSLEALWGPAELVELPGPSFGSESVLRAVPTGLAIPEFSPAKPEVLAFGATGAREVWTLSTGLPLASVVALLQESDEMTSSHRNALRVLRQAPWFYAGHSAASLIAGPLPMPAQAEVLDYAAFEPTTIDAFGGGLAPVQHPFWDVDIEVPTLPCVGSCAAEALVVVGVDVPTFGFVPLGWAARRDREGTGGADQVLSATPIDPMDGRVRVSVAPPHDGLEGLPLVAFVLIFNDRVDDGDGRPVALLRYDDVAGGELSASPVAELGLPVSVELAGSEEAPLLTWASASPADVVRVALQLGDGAWELFAPGAPAEPTDVRALLPDDVQVPVRVRFAQSMRLAAGAPDLDSLLRLGGQELGALDESVLATISDR